MNIICQFEVNIDQVNEQYYCTDQTNIRQKISSRNFYDTAQIDVFVPNTDIIVGQQLYSSANSQFSSDFNNCLQNINNLLSVNYNNIIGTIIFNYAVLNTENLKVPCISKVQSVSGVFKDIDLYVFIEPKPENSRILYTFYKN